MSGVEGRPGGLMDEFECGVGKRGKEETRGMGYNHIQSWTKMILFVC